MGLQSLKSAGEAGRLEISVRVDVAVKSEGSPRQNSFLLVEPQSFLLDLLDEVYHIMEGSVFSSS